MNRHLANVLLYPYYYGTFPFRAWSHARRDAAGRAPVVVLFYHRVADEHLNPWSITRRQFARQIEWLKRRYRLVSLAEAQECIRRGYNNAPLFSITFDDGYGDNSAFALPYLVRRRVPFTYFVSVHHVQHGEPFSHDVAAGHAHRTNTIDELRALAGKGVEIGLHTRTHLDLGREHDPRRLHDEVVVAGQDLAQLVGCPIRYFAFPFGLHENLNADVFRMARGAGYRGVCSAYGGYNFPGDDAFHIQRCHADGEWVRWKNCVTVDPRKVRQTVRYEYRDAGGAQSTVSSEVSEASAEHASSCLARVGAPMVDRSDPCPDQPLAPAGVGEHADQAGER